MADQEFRFSYIAQVSVGTAAFFLCWVLSICGLIFYPYNSLIGEISLFYQIFAFFYSLKSYLKNKSRIKSLMTFYELSQKLDDLKLLRSEKPFELVLKNVLKLGEFDWAVLFLMDFDKESFEAVASHGIAIEKFSSIPFDEVSGEEKSDGVSLTINLLNLAFKRYGVHGALAGSAIEREDVYYGCILVGRDGKESHLNEKDQYRLNILTDQVAICLHNHRLHNELSFRAEELVKKQQLLQKELDLAKAIQDGVMRRDLSPVNASNIESFVQSARFIGGDFLRFFKFDGDSRLGILIGDVCGKGIPAAMVMAVVVSLFREKLTKLDCSKDLMKNVNLGLKEILGAGSRFNSTALLASYDPFKKTIHYSSAGHDFPLIFRKDTGEIEELESTGTLLGIFIESEYTCRTVQLNSGDLVIFYTDGLVDFFEFQHGAEDGFEYLKLYIKERLEKGHKAIAQELRELILKDKTFLKDDITFLLLSVE